MEFDNPASENVSMAYSNPSYSGAQVRPANMKERLDMAIKQAEVKLADVKRAKEIFEKHPALEELINIMQRNNF